MTLKHKETTLNTSIGVLKSMQGKDFLQALIDGQLPQAPLGQVLGFRLAEVDTGHAVFIGEPAREHYNPFGAVHGGYAATLLDSAMGCAVHSSLEAGYGFTTLELKVNLVRALNDNIGPVRAEGKLIHRSRRIATSEARLIDSRGKLYAHGTCTCLVFPLE